MASVLVEKKLPLGFHLHWIRMEDVQVSVWKRRCSSVRVGVFNVEVSCVSGSVSVQEIFQKNSRNAAD